MPSRTPIPGRCAARCRDGGYCENYPVSGSTRCRMHGGTSPGAPRGEANGNYEHGAYSREWASSLEDSEASSYPELVEELADPGEEREVARSLAAELIAVRFHRSGDPEFAYGYETICDAYGLYGDDEESEI